MHDKARERRTAKSCRQCAVAIAGTKFTQKRAALAVAALSLAGVLGAAVAPRTAAADAPVQGDVSVTVSCYSAGFGSILALLSSPLGTVQSASGTLSASAMTATSTSGGQVAITSSTTALYDVSPGTYAVQLSAHDALGTTYAYSGMLVIPACDNDVAGIEAGTGPAGGYLTFTDGAAVDSAGPGHVAAEPSALVNTRHAPIVGLGVVSSATGSSGQPSYDFAGADGGVFTVGAPFYGSAAGFHLHAPVVGIALTPDHDGYWLVGADGGIFAFGDAHYYGSLAGRPLSQPVVGMAVDQATGGYWLVARDGGVFAFNAPFFGSAAALRLDRPVVGMESAPDGSGYRLVASDGGVFSFHEPFAGSMAGHTLNGSIVGITEDPASGGYWLAGSDGGVFAFGAPYYGSKGVAPPA